MTSGKYDKTEEHKKNLSLSRINRKKRLGYINSEKTRKKMSESHKGQTAWNKGIKGHVHSGSFKKGHVAWNYIDGRSNNASPARYGDDWEKIRMLVYLRDKFTCQECGITANESKRVLHIHHKVPFLVSFDNSLKNLITLCPSCHRKVEMGLIKCAEEEK